MIAAGRVTARLGDTLSRLGRGEDAVARMREALAALGETTAPPEVLADLQASLGYALVFSGHHDEAFGAIEEALILAQHHELAETLTGALISKSALLEDAGRGEEARALLEASVEIARRHGLTRNEMRAEINLADYCMTRDLPGAEEHARAGLALARRWGDRHSEVTSGQNLIYVLVLTGRLQEALQLGTDLLSAGERPWVADRSHYALAHIEALRGNVEAARVHLAGFRAWTQSDDPQNRSAYAAAEAAVSLAGGNSLQALEAARRAIDEALGGGLTVSHEVVRVAFPVAVEAAIAVGNHAAAERLSTTVAARPRGEIPPFLRAQLARARALVASARGDHEAVEQNHVAAESTFRELGYPYWIACAQLDRAAWLVHQQRLDESATLAADAAATLEMVGAAPMLARARALLEPDTIGNLADDQQAVAQRGLSPS